jgi:hypothetical protein
MVENELNEVLRATVILAVDQTMNRRGRLYRWSYSKQFKMHDQLMEGLMALIDGKTTQARVDLMNFVQDYRAATTLREGPFAGCLTCRVRCWLRPDVRVISKQPGLKLDATYAIEQGSNDRVAHENLATLAMATVRRAIEDIPREASASLAVCLVAHLTTQSGFSRSTQVDAAETASLILQGTIP